MKYVLGIVIGLVVVGAGALLYAWSGIYNIAATEPHWEITSALIQTLRDRSIDVRSNEIQTPNLDDPRLKEVAFSHYHEMCRLCHGALGYEPEEFSKGLYPIPPSMTSGIVQKARSEAEIYWIVKNGIKMSGMPAFGPTHNEEQLWGLVALTKDIPQMSPEQYREHVRAANSEGDTVHRHIHGEPDREKDHGHGGEPADHGEAEEDHH